MNLYRALVLKGWWLVLIVLFGAAVLLGRHAPELEVNSGTRAFLNDDDPDLAYYESSRPIWGFDEYAIVCVTRDDWITSEGVSLLQQVVADLQAAPNVASVTSILDIPLLRQDPTPATSLPAVLRLRSQIVTLGQEGIDYARAREELLSHTQALGSLVSESGRDLAILVYLDIPADIRAFDPEWARLQAENPPSPETRARIEELRPVRDAAVVRLREQRIAMAQGVRDVAAAWSARLPEPIRLSGTTIIRRNIDEHVQHDLRVFGIACLGLFLLAFVIFYRRVRFVVLPILTCLLPVAIIVGFMAWRGMQVTMTTADLPLLLFVLMLPYTVYFIERYRERRVAKPEEAGAESTFEAARWVFVPCLFSCLTTMAGFAALTTSRTHPIRDFGWMMAAGMGIGLVTVFLAIPSMSRPLRPLAVDPEGVARPVRGWVRFFLYLAVEHPVGVLIGGALLLVMAVLGALRLDAQTKFTEYFWPKSEVYQGLEYIDTRLGGTTSLEIILESDDKGFFLKPEGLKALEAAARYFERVPETGNVRHFATLVREVQKKAPMAETLLPVLVHMKEVKPLVQEYLRVDEEKGTSVSRIFVRMRETAPTLDRNEILAGLREHLATTPELKDLEVRETGIFLLYANMLNSLIQSQRDTFLLVIAAVYVMLVLLVRSLRLALVVLLPQVLPAVTVLGVLGWAGIPLDLVTVMIASIAMGVGIDAAIQYTVRYRKELEIDGDRRAAVRRAHGTIGRAIWIATTVIVIGFGILVLSDFRPSVWFGVFTALAMLMSQISALTILPALLLVTRLPKVDATDREPASSSSASRPR